MATARACHNIGPVDRLLALKPSANSLACPAKEHSISNALSQLAVAQQPQRRRRLQQAGFVAGATRRLAAARPAFN